VGFFIEKFSYILVMENVNLIKIEDNKILLKYPEEVLTFEPLKKPIFEVGTEFFDIKGIRYFLTKRKP
jgi:hypothetical protein